MFTLPPRPPKDYYIENVPPTQQSGAEFTPDALPRVTQSNLAKFCAPIEANEDDKPAETKVQPVVPSVLDRWTNEWRAYWVPKPGENAYYLHDMYKKHTVLVDPDYNPAYKHMPKIFCRSFKYELDCIEEARQKKLLKKMQREHLQAIHKKSAQNDSDINANKTPITVLPCEHQPPFWWKHGMSEGNARLKMDDKLDLVPQPDKSEYKASFLRWQEEPNIFDQNLTDPCKRRAEMALVGQPFRNEAINWYYQNHPPPNIKFRPEKFSK